MALQGKERVLLFEEEEEDYGLCQIVQSPKPSPIFASYIIIIHLNISDQIASFSTIIFEKKLLLLFKQM